MPEPDVHTQLFIDVRSLFREFESECVVQKDEPHDYYLGSQKVRTDGYRVGFGGVGLRKRYVAVYIQPLYVYPDLTAVMPHILIPRMHGKSCFNFNAASREHLDALKVILLAGAERYRSQGWL